VADEPENLVMRYLRSTDTKLDRVIEDVQDLKVCMTSVEQRLDHIEKRLELVDNPYGGVRE